MRPPRFELAFDQRCIPERLEEPVMRNSTLAVARPCDRNLLPVLRRPRQRGVDRAGGRVRNATGHGQVTPLDAVCGKLLRKPFMRSIGFGDHAQPGRILVDPMDDPGPRHAANA